MRVDVSSKSWVLLVTFNLVYPYFYVLNSCKVQKSSEANCPVSSYPKKEQENLPTLESRLNKQVVYWKNEKNSHLDAFIQTYMFINFQQKVPPIRLFLPIFLLILREISHLYFYSDSSSIRNSRVLAYLKTYFFKDKKTVLIRNIVWFFSFKKPY